MHGHGWGGHGMHGWGGHGHHQWGGPFGFGGAGWIFPALIIGRIIEEAMRQGQPQWPQAPSGPQSAPASPTPQPAARPAGPAWSEPVQAATLQCANCQRTVAAGYAYCPYCGQSTSRRECRYCGREVKAGTGQCIGCGAPVAKASPTSH